MGTEIYHLKYHAIENTDFPHNAAGTTAPRPKNTVVVLPVGFNSNFLAVDASNQNYDIGGNWIKPVLGWNTKHRVSFNSIVHDSASKQGLNLRCYHGLMKNTYYKMKGESAASLSAFHTEILAELYKQLAESKVSANYLDYARKNRVIQINGQFDIKPNRNGMIRVDNDLSAANKQTSYNAPPPVTFTINHPVPRMKTRVSTNHSSAAHENIPLMENSWVPFTAFVCEQLLTTSGSFKIESNSRMYFTDN